MCPGCIYTLAARQDLKNQRRGGKYNYHGAKIIFVALLCFLFHKSLFLDYLAACKISLDSLEVKLIGSLFLFLIGFIIIISHQ